MKSKKSIALGMSLIMLSLEISACKTRTPEYKTSANIEQKSIEQTFVKNKTRKDNPISEIVLREDGKYESKISEDIISESYVIEVVVSEDEDSFYEQLPPEMFEYDINWESVITNFAVGSTIMLVCGTLTVATMGTPLYYFFATSMLEISKETLIGSALGAVSNTVVEGIKNGKMSTELAKKYAIEGAASGVMWGAISGVASVSIKTLATTLPKTLFDYTETPKWYVDANGDTYNADGMFIGHTSSKEEEWYLINTSGDVLGEFNSSGHMASEISKAYPDHLSKITKNGRYSYDFKVDDNMVIHANEEIGKLNEAGDIIGIGTYQGEKIGSIDSDGKLIENNLRAIKAGVNFNGNGVIQNEYRAASSEMLRGNAIRYKDYLDDTGEIIAYSVKSSDYKGTERIFLMSETDNKILGILKDDTKLLPNWNMEISKLAADGVRDARNMSVSLIENGTKYDYGPSVTEDIMSIIRKTGEFPDNLLQGHHRNNVANYPWLANNPDNITFYNREDHLMIGHRGNYVNVSEDSLTNLKEIYNDVHN